MNLSKSLMLAIAVFLLTFTANQANAQSTTVQATGTVLAPITISGTNLDFGTSIYPGIAKSVTRTDATAAQFDISGEAGKEVTATFTLPDSLAHTVDATAIKLPISFSTTDAGYATASTAQGTATAFNPATVLTTRLDSTSAALYIWLGGTVSPPNTQKSGAYSGDITLDMAYTGN